MKLPRAPQRTTPGFAFPTVTRSLRACLGTRQFGQKEMAEVLDFFGTPEPQCVFCGSSEVKRWDHLVPVNRGGETVLGNMVPACARCDDSKGDKPFEEWMISDAKQSPRSRGVGDIEDRIDLIRVYVHHYGYRVRTLDERLNEEERERLVGIQSDLQALRDEVDSLIEDYRARTGSR